MHSENHAPVIDDFRIPDQIGAGYEPRDYEAQPAGSVQFCAPMPPAMKIPRVEWDERIRELEENKATLVHVRARAGLKTLYQGQTNYCWAFATVNAVRILRAANGLPNLDLSATAVAYQIKGGRNVGGNTYEAIPHIATHGVPETKYWPLNSFDRRHISPAMKLNAQRTRLTEWYELKSNDFDALASCLLRNIPVVMGQFHWMHMVCGLALRKLKNGGYGVEIENSWGDWWGNKGLGVLTEDKAISFDQAAPRVVTAGVGTDEATDRSGSSGVRPADPGRHG